MKDDQAQDTGRDRSWLFEAICTLDELLDRPLEESPLGRHLKKLDEEADAASSRAGRVDAGR